ncbi:ElyC/SanA/YdcF family protein [Thermodesulfobacteriota bacterium]
MNLFFSIIKSLLLFFITIAALQIGAVYLLRLMQPTLAPADLVAIMPSSKERIAEGCMAAANPGAAYLMLINNSPQALAKYAAKYGVPESVTLLPGGTSRSSFEDIHVTVQTALDRNLKSVILVTSDFHLPRALFLLYAYNLSIGRELRIQYTTAWEQTSPLKRLLHFYSEIVKFWGSAAELGGYLLTGQLPLDSDKVLAVRNSLKRVFQLVE